MIRIVEVGPRDGLQSETPGLPVKTRVELIRRLEKAGATRIETVSFAHPRHVPQMAGAEKICDALETRTFSSIGLVMNEKGLERALDCDLDEINFVAYASDGYAQKNSRAPAADRNSEAAAMVRRAKNHDIHTSVTIAVAFGDPFDGFVSPDHVVQIATEMAEAGVDEIALGDTIGVGDPSSVRDLLGRLRDAIPSIALRCHFHNTRNTGYANAVAAMDAGADALDSAVGGYGGSPFSPGAAGNVASEDLVSMLHRMGIDTGLDEKELATTGMWLAHQLGYDEPPAMLGRVPNWP